MGAVQGPGGPQVKVGGTPGGAPPSSGEYPWGHLPPSSGGHTPKFGGVGQGAPLVLKGVGVGGTSLAVTQEDCLVCLSGQRRT